jgi:hypothetical protein
MVAFDLYHRQRDHIHHMERHLATKLQALVQGKELMGSKIETKEVFRH